MKNKRLEKVFTMGANHLVKYYFPYHQTFFEELKTRKNFFDS